VDRKGASMRNKLLETVYEAAKRDVRNHVSMVWARRTYLE
jgi:hypothetical protein